MSINLTNTESYFVLEKSLNLRYIDNLDVYDSCYYEINAIISPEKLDELDSGRPYNVTLDLKIINSTEINVYLYRSNSK